MTLKCKSSSHWLWSGLCHHNKTFKNRNDAAWRARVICEDTFETESYVALYKLWKYSSGWGRKTKLLVGWTMTCSTFPLYLFPSQPSRRTMSLCVRLSTSSTRWSFTKLPGMSSSKTHVSFCGHFCSIRWNTFLETWDMSSFHHSRGFTVW